MHTIAYPTFWTFHMLIACVLPMSDDAAPVFRWTRLVRRNRVSWFLHPEGRDARMYQIANVLRNYGSCQMWRAYISYGGLSWWVLTGHTLTARRSVEDWLARKCWKWDGEIVNSAYKRIAP